MKLWVDDLRPAPHGYTWVKTVDDAITMIKWYEHQFNDDTILIDLDHDAGKFVDRGGDYIKLLDWLEQEGIVDTSYFFHLHTMNSVGRQNMRAIIQHNGWKEIP